MMSKESINRNEEQLIDQAIENKDIDNYKCLSCGANMQYDPNMKKLICPYCESTKEIDFSNQVRERDFSEFGGFETWTGEVIRVRCDNCGAEEIFEKDQIATNCSFCNSPKVLTIIDTDGVKPNAIVPFSVDQDKALKFCAKWLKRRIFTPRKFKKSLNFQSVHGTYYPLWTFDSVTVTVYSGVLGKTVTKTVRRGNKTYTTTETRWFSVSGNIQEIFDDILVNGSQRLPEKYFDTLCKFSADSCVEYRNSFLAGFSALRYSVAPEEAYSKAEKIMRQRIEQAIMRKHNADKVQHLDMHVDFQGKSFKYLLIPLYITATNYKNKLYNQYINGTNGKVKGKAPLSPFRIIIAVLLLLGLGTCLALFVDWNQVASDSNWDLYWRMMEKYKGVFFDKLW